MEGHQEALFGRGPDRRKTPRPDAADRRANSVEWVALFRGSDQAAVNAIVGDSPVLSLSAGQTLLRFGELNANVYILLHGTLCAYLDGNLSNPAGGIVIAPGDCIGELSVIDGKPVSAQVVAHTDARVLKLSREIFWGRLMTLPGVASNLAITLTERMRRTNQMAMNTLRQQLELDHLRKELDAARQLQTSMLPLQRPLFPDRGDLEICGLMEPAAIVGGDLFDTFFVDEDHLFLCVGDVSGHGIAAALFMARTIGLLRVLAMNTLAPDELLHALNERLCIANDANLFVTVFCAFLNVKSGQLTYSNGGHCPPLVMADGKASLLPLPKGPLVGALSGARYSALARELKPGDTLLAYTDGVTEASQADGEEFAEQRCLALLEGLSQQPLPEVLDRLRLAVTQFTGSPVLADDCTMLGVRRVAAG